MEITKGVVKMNELIALLMAIREFAKDIHYNVRGLSAISLHKYADEVSEDLSEYIDSIKEICLLGNYQEPLSSKDYLRRAVALIPNLPKEDKDKYKELQRLIADALTHIQNMELNRVADANLIGNIAENLQKSVGLINLILE